MWNRFIIQCKHEAEEEHLLGYLHWWCYVSMYLAVAAGSTTGWWWHRNGVVVSL